jgi:hypothetical protein
VFDEGMTDIPETGRLAGHVLIDAVMAYDIDQEDEDANLAAMDLALARLGELHAVSVIRSEHDDSVQVDASNLVAPAVLCMIWLIDQLSDATGSSHEALAARLREFLDS